MRFKPLLHAFAAAALLAACGVIASAQVAQSPRELAVVVVARSFRFWRRLIRSLLDVGRCGWLRGAGAIQSQSRQQ